MLCCVVLTLPCLLQFNNEDEISMELTISDELLAQKNEKVCMCVGCGNRRCTALPATRGLRWRVGLSCFSVQCPTNAPSLGSFVSRCVSLRSRTPVCVSRHSSFLTPPPPGASSAALCCICTQCGGKLQRTMSGKINTVFAHILRGLSGAKITRAKEEVFRNVSGVGCCVRCSYKADDGFLYPLDKAFFYVHKPPMCINHRSAGGRIEALSSSGKGQPPAPAHGLTCAPCVWARSRGRFASTCTHTWC